MATPEEVKNAVKNLNGGEKFLGRREIKILPEILWEDELPEKIVQGTYNNGNGILVATNKRLMFIDKGIMSLKVEDFPYSNITSIQYSTGMLMGSIEIYTSGNKAEIKNAIKDQVKSFCEYVRARITKTSPHASAPVMPPKTDQSDAVSQLEKLAQLKERGILTEEEFQDQKRKILIS